MTAEHWAEPMVDLKAAKKADPSAETLVDLMVVMTAVHWAAMMVAL
jgi:hypothetical protein